MEEKKATTTQSSEPLFWVSTAPIGANWAVTLSPIKTDFAPKLEISNHAGNNNGLTPEQNDALLRQVHPIFLTTHATEDKRPVEQSNFDKILSFLRLCLEGALKFIDILVDAVVQVAKLGVWVVAISWALIVVTLMTNTTDKFIDILNSSIFPIFGIETQIQKIDNSSSSSLQSNSLLTADESNLTDAERQARIEARRERQAELSATE